MLVSLSNIVGASAFHLETCYLFVRSDIKGILFPILTFAFIVSPSFCLSNALLSTIWVLIHILLLSIDNQSLSIEEDKHNKPWRPLPSGRITQKTASHVAAALHPMTIFISFLLGGPRLFLSSAFLSLLVFIYDHIRLNEHWFWRNTITTSGYMSLEYGVMLLLANGTPPHHITLNALAMSGCILFTTVHTQDFQDEVGDRAMGRKTLIIQIGPTLSRISILFFVLLWSWYLPIVWEVPTLFRAYFVGLGVYLAGRVFTSCAVSDDEYNFRLYNFWLVSMHLLPLAPKLGCSY